MQVWHTLLPSKREDMDMDFNTDTAGQTFVTNAHCQNPSYSVGVYDIPIQQPSHSSSSMILKLFNRRSAIWFGIALVICGAMSIVGEAIALRHYAALSESGSGILGGAAFVCSGAITIVAGVHKIDSLIKAETASSTLAVIFGIAQLTISAIGLKEDVEYFSCYNFGCTYPYYACACRYSDWEHQAIAGNAIMITFSSIAIIFAIGILIFCVKSICNKKQHQVFNGGSNHYMQNPHIVTAPNLQTNVFQPATYAVQNPQQQVARNGVSPGVFQATASSQQTPSLFVASNNFQQHFIQPVASTQQIPIVVMTTLQPQPVRHLDAFML